MSVRVWKAVGLAAAMLSGPVVAHAADACPRLELAGAPAGGKPGAPIAGLNDITSAIAGKRQDGTDGVGFNLRPAAGARLRAYTAAHVGRPIAFAVDGRTRLDTIRAPTSGDAFWISPMDANEARILAGRVNNCVTP
jgi:preprotein translocase subunit SecD